MVERPNVLFIITDQMRADHVGFGGNPTVRTPNIDALAARSTVFERCYVSNPLCTPNRSSMLTGRMPSVHGARMNGMGLDPRQRTFVGELHDAGYRTALLGKSHLQAMGFGETAPPESRGLSGWAWDEPGPGWDRFEVWQSHRERHVELPIPFYGFDEVDLVVAHADICSGHYYRWLSDRVEDPEQLRGPQNGLEHDSPSGQVWRTAVPEELYPTEYVVERTLGFLDRMAAEGTSEPGGRRPWFAYCSFPDPHHPFTPPGDWFDRHDPVDMVLPKTYHDDHSSSMPMYRSLLGMRGTGMSDGIFPFSPTEEELREFLAREYGSIELIDSGVGRILGHLAQLGMSENTIVVFTSDHGDMFGDHGMMFKGGMHYDGCLRVPLAIATPEPQHEPGRTSSLVSTLDLAQTLLDLTGQRPFEGMQGHSLRPLLEPGGGDHSIRSGVLIEEDQPVDLHGLGGTGGRLRMRTLVTDEARITAYQGSTEGELFDLREDPDELHNLWHEPSATELRTRMTGELLESLMAHSEEGRPLAYLA